MTVDRTNPAYRWKTLLLGDQARLDVEAYGCALGPAEWRPAGLEQNKQQLITLGAQATYQHAFGVFMAKEGAEIGGAKEFAAETDEELRKRIRAMNSAFAAEAISRVDTNHAGLLTLGYRAHEFTSTGTISPGAAVNVPLNGGADATDFAGWFGLLIGTAGTHELVTITDGGASWVLIETVVGSYPANAQIIPVEWAVAGAWPTGPLRFEKQGSPDVFSAGLEFQFVDEPSESA